MLQKFVGQMAIFVHNVDQIERHRKRTAEIDAVRIVIACADSLSEFVCETVEPGATVLTDAWKGCNDLEKRGYRRIKTNLSSSGNSTHVVMPGVHRRVLGLRRFSVLPSSEQGFLEGIVVRPEVARQNAGDILFYSVVSGFFEE